MERYGLYQWKQRRGYTHVQALNRQGHSLDASFVIETIRFGWGYVGARKKEERERDQSLNTVVHDSLGVGVPWYVTTQLKSCPIERLGQYLNGLLSSQFQFSSVQFSIHVVQLSTVEQQGTTGLSLYNCFGCCHIASLRVFMWISVRNIHWIKVMQVLIYCTTEIHMYQGAIQKFLLGGLKISVKLIIHE